MNQNDDDDKEGGDDEEKEEKVNIEIDDDEFPILEDVWKLYIEKLQDDERIVGDCEKDGIQYKIHKKRPLIIVPKQLEDQILNLAHDQFDRGHFGLRRPLTI